MVLDVHALRFVPFHSLILYELYELCKEMTRDLARCNIIPDRINRKTVRVLWSFCLWFIKMYKNVKWELIYFISDKNF